MYCVSIRYYLIVMIILSSELSSDKNPLIRLPNPNNQVMTYILQLQYEPSLVKSVNAIIYSHNEWWKAKRKQYLRLLCQTFAFSFVKVVQRHYRRYTGRGLFSNQNDFLSFFGLGIVNAPAVIIIKLSVKEESDQRSGLNQKFSF